MIFAVVEVTVDASTLQDHYRLATAVCFHIYPLRVTDAYVLAFMYYS
jgi:hypothetical protein